MGYQNSPGYPGSLSHSTLSASQLVAGTTYKYLDLGGMYNITTSNVTFVGCRFPVQQRLRSQCLRLLGHGVQ